MSRSFFFACLSCLLSIIINLSSLSGHAQCSPISGIQLIDSSRGALAMQWEEVPGNSEYELAFRFKGLLQPFQLIRQTSNLAILRLSECTSYEVKVRPLCSTVFSPVQVFTTACQPCTPVVQHSIMAIHSNSIEMAVDIGSRDITSNGIQFEYRNIGETAFETILIKDGIFLQSSKDTFEISGLTENSNYEARISHVCIQNNFTHQVLTASEPGPLFSFSTLPISCRPVSNIVVSTAQTSASLQWTGNPSATGYEINFREAGTSAFSLQTSNSENAGIVGLKAGTTYEARVRAICSGEPSAFSSLVSFTTLPPDCTVPVNLSAGAVTETTASLQWAAVPSAISYIIEFREAGKTFSTTSTTVNAKTLTGLLPGTAYEFRVSANCPGIAGSFSDLAGFSTLIECLSPGNVNVTDITQNTAQVNWNLSSNALFYICRFRKRGEAASQTVSTTNLFVSLAGLESSAIYEVQVQSVCSGNNSSFSEVVPFATAAPPPCKTPAFVSVGALLPTSANISWGASLGATSYIIKFRKAGAQDSSQVTSSTTTIALTSLLPATTYEVRVQSACEERTSGLSDPVFFTTIESCDPPSNTRLSSVSHNAALIEWDNIVSSLGYVIQFKAEGSAVSSVVNSDNNTISLVNLTPSTVYIVRIQTLCALNSSRFSSEFRFTTKPAPPCNRVTGLAPGIIKTNSAGISWQVVDGATNYKIIYGIRGSNVFTSSVSALTSITINGLIPASEYELLVLPVCGAIDGPNSDTLRFSTLVPCEAPVNLRAPLITSSTAEIQWDEAGGADSYTIFYKILGGTNLSQSSSITSATLSGLEPNTRYEITVQSACASGINISSPITITTLPAIACIPPTGISTGSIAPTSAELNWQPVTGSTSFNVRYAVSGSGVFLTRSTATTRINIPDLLPGTGYEFQVQTVCGQNISNFSSIFVFSTFSVCNIPENLSVGSVTSNSAFISWSNVPAAGSYNLFFKKSGETSFTSQHVTGSSLSLAGLSPNTLYEVKVQAICAGGNSDFSQLINFSTQVLCSFPPGLLAAEITETSAVLSWGRVQGAKKLNIEFKNAEAISFTSSSADPEPTTKRIEGLLPGKSYEVRIQSLCGNINSEFSPVIRFTTRAVSCATPSRPTLSSATLDAASLTWTGIPGAIRYNVRYRPNGAQVFTTITSPTNSITLTGLQAATSYEATVQAECNFSNSSFGPALLFGTACPLPSNVSVTTLASGQIRIAFDAMPFYRSYQVSVGKTPALLQSTAKLLNFTSNPFDVSKAQLGIIPSNLKNEKYTIKICAICANGQRSEFTPAIIIH